MSKDRIPVISDERLLELYERIRPARKNFMGDLCWLRTYSLKELKQRSFIWDAKDILDVRVNDTDVRLRPITTFRCLHAYSAPGLFTPKVADVLAQIPDSLINSAFAFQMIEMPKTTSDFCQDEFSRQAFKDGYHTSVIELYASK